MITVALSLSALSSTEHKRALNTAQEEGFYCPKSLLLTGTGMTEVIVVIYSSGGLGRLSGLPGSEGLLRKFWLFFQGLYFR